MKYDAQAKYKSSLAVNGLVSWSTEKIETQSKDPHVAEVVLTTRFQDIDWAFLQSVYGWIALQYQAWVRGYLDIVAHAVQDVVIYTDNLLEFWVDDKHYFGGDLYSFRRAPLVLHLERGSHRIDLRLIRDVRAMGATCDPTISIRLKAEIVRDCLTIDEQQMLVSDVVNGFLASPFASVPIRNNSEDWVDILNMEPVVVCV